MVTKSTVIGECWFTFIHKTVYVLINYEPLKLDKDL